MLQLLSSPMSLRRRLPGEAGRQGAPDGFEAGEDSLALGRTGRREAQIVLKGADQSLELSHRAVP